jgi:hypothetical protein
MRAASDWVTAVAVGRIQDKTRWTKALGEALMFVYGICKEEVGRSTRNGALGRETTGQSLTQRLIAIW